MPVRKRRLVGISTNFEMLNLSGLGPRQWGRPKQVIEWFLILLFFRKCYSLDLHSKCYYLNVFDYIFD